MKTREMRDHRVRFGLSLHSVCQGGKPTCFTAQKRLRSWRSMCLWRQGTEVKRETKDSIKILRDQTQASISSLYNQWLLRVSWRHVAYLPERLCLISVDLVTQWGQLKVGRDGGPLLESEGLSKDLPYRQWELQPSSPTRHTRRVTAAFYILARDWRFCSGEITSSTQGKEYLQGSILRVSKVLTEMGFLPHHTHRISNLPLGATGWNLNKQAKTSRHFRKMSEVKEPETKRKKWGDWGNKSAESTRKKYNKIVIDFPRAINNKQQKLDAV